LQRPRDLAQLAGHRVRRRFENPGDLHGERGTSGYDAPVPQPLRPGARQRERIDARMPPEEAVFVTHDRLDIVRRHLLDADRVPPDVGAIGEGPQRRAVAGEDHQGVGGGTTGERGRQELVGEEKNCEQRRKRNSRGRSDPHLTSCRYFSLFPSDTTTVSPPPASP
jgi:hypothetical protein